MSDRGDAIRDATGLQRRLLVYASMRLRCGLDRKIAKKLITETADELMDAMWELTQSEARQTEYWYAFYDYDGGSPRDAYMRLEYNDFMAIDDAALLGVDRVTLDHIELLPKKYREAARKRAERRTGRGEVE